MAVPITKLGDEIGYTTVFYYSKHTPERREEWRHQWKKRADLDINSTKRYEDDRKFIENRRNQAANHHLEYKEQQIQKEKFELQLRKEKNERKEAKKKVYEKEKQLWDANSEETDKVQGALRWTSEAAEMRKQRREKRKQQLENLQNEIKSSEKEIDQNPRHYLYLSDH